MHHTQLQHPLRETVGQEEEGLANCPFLLASKAASLRNASQSQRRKPLSWIAPRGEWLTGHHSGKHNDAYAKSQILKEKL